MTTYKSAKYNISGADLTALNATQVTSGTLPDARLSNQVKVVKSGSTPSSPQEGDMWYDTTNDILKVYDTTSTAFVKVVRVTPTLDSISGNIVTATAGNLTLNGTGFLSSGLIVAFTPSGGSASNVTVTPSSDIAATVAIPSAIYGQSVDVVIAITVTNSDVKTSSGVNKTVVVLPTGGTITTTGSYRVHTFLSTGTFVNTLALTNLEYLVLAGGGGGGSRHAGGGGGGGYRSSVVGENSGGGASAETRQSVSAASYTVTVGAGGAGGVGDGNNGIGLRGENSVFNGITSTGGGGGMNDGDPTTNRDGGTGGGGDFNADTHGTGTAGQGYDGGDGSGGSPHHGGGGGGTGQIGGNATGGTAGAGGNGTASSITGSSVTRGGGGGGGAYQGTGGAGGSGGGGAGSAGTSGAVNGTANLGGGGGGLGEGTGTTGTAGAGGSGIVIIRYIV